ncbi:molybdopterin binding oxidoreductase [Mycena floridula]|nr:molybdopterin binding oxidoreductase [Mycena floridula]
MQTVRFRLCLSPTMSEPTVPDVKALFAEEKLGWTGYVEWEDYPDKKAQARAILNATKFTPIPEFQFVPLPKTNPVLIGYRWKEYHQALGLGSIVDMSWEVVQREKPALIHLLGKGCPYSFSILDFPYNGETRREQLMEGKITQNKYHFVRNHGGMPDIKEDAFELEIGGLVNEPVKLSLKDLKDPSKFPQMEVTVTLQCSGTRRIEQINEYPGDGDELINAPWGTSTSLINARAYTEHRLKKVLKYACKGVKPSCQHLEFIGADTYFKKNNIYNYAVSVPLRKVRQNEEVLLAWEMNGEPLPQAHGAPLRVVCTGYIGARSCKWLYKINAIARPSLAPVQAQEYLYYTPQIGKQNTRYSNGFSIQNMPVSSAIIFPENKQVIIHDGSISLKGWAYSGGGNWVERVEISNDGGSVWYAVDPDDMTEKVFQFFERLWKIDLPVDAEGWLEFCVRCWDSSNNTEPTFVRSAWKLMSTTGIKIYSVNRSRPATAKRLKEMEARGQAFEPLCQPLEFTLEETDANKTPQEYLAAMQKHPREPLN